MSETPKENLKLYGRIGVSVVLYTLFIIFSVNAVLTGTLADKPFLLGGLLIGAVFLLPRSARRPSEDGELTEDDVAHLKNVQKWLTVVRFSYFLIAAFLWFGLPEIM
jgi:hypothetical protein